MVFVEEFGDRVGRHPCLGFEDTGGLRRRGDTEHRTPVSGEVVDRGAQRRCLAGPGRAFDEHQTVVSGDGAGEKGSPSASNRDGLGNVNVLKNVPNRSYSDGTR